MIHIPYHTTPTVPYRIPYLQHTPRRPKPYLIVMNIGRKKVKCGSFDTRVGAFIEMNRLLGILNPGGGLLPLQKVFRARRRASRAVENVITDALVERKGIARSLELLNKDVAMEIPKPNVMGQMFLRRDDDERDKNERDEDTVSGFDTEG